jgi:hypothetical protein
MSGVVVAVVVAKEEDGRALKLEAPPEDEHDALRAAIFARVSGPTLPMGLIPFALWKAATAFAVTDPK